MKRPVFHRTTGFNVIGYKTPFGSKPSGFYVDFQPANSEAWTLLGGIVALVVLCGFGLPMIAGSEFQFGTNTLPTGLSAAIAAAVVGFGVVFVFSETADRGDAQGLDERPR